MRNHIQLGLSGGLATPGGGLRWAVGKHMRWLTPGPGLPKGLTLRPASVWRGIQTRRRESQAVQWEVKIFTEEGGGISPIWEERGISRE